MEESETDTAGSVSSSVIAARGTGDGLVLRIDGRVEGGVLKDAIREFMSARRSFLTGNEVAFEWVGRLPDDGLVDELKAELTAEFEVVVKSSKLRENRQRESEQPLTGPLAAESGKNLSLFDGMQAVGLAAELVDEVAITKSGAELKETRFDAAVWDEADARVVCTTLRSGQRLETEHSLIIMGDVNSGAEIVAGGDVIVLGTLRGVAHAGAYDETGAGRIIFALNLQPTQLRIGAVISRGTCETQKVAEIARVEDGTIVVEKYQSRGWTRGCTC